MTGTELLDRDHDGRAGSADYGDSAGHDDHADRLRYRDPLGLVSEGRPFARTAKVLAVVAVCGAGLLAGFGLFGGSAAKRPLPAEGIVKAADTLSTHPGTAHHRPVHKQPAHKPPAHTSRTHRPAKQPPRAAHSSPSHIPVRTQSGHGVYQGGGHQGSPHPGGSHKAGGGSSAVRRPATARPAAPAGTARTSQPSSSSGTVPTTSR